MKKLLLPVVAAAVVLSVTGCDKKGTVSGTVIDPFTGESVSMPTVWIDSSIYGTQKTGYDKSGLQEGKFKFEQVPVGNYLIKARRSKYVLGQQNFVTTNEKPNVEITLYEYSDQVAPGLYVPNPKGAEKISNDWAIFSTTCKESIAGYRISYEQNMNASAVPDAKNKKKAKKADIKVNNLPQPKVIGADVDVLYCNSSSVTASVEAASYSAISGPVSSHSDCMGFENDKSGIFASPEKKTPLTVSYKAEGLYEIKGNLPKGRQILVLTQDGKVLQTYYVEVK
ncbi:MAG: carboxypeptidase-like regulatory domain-containing protein [Fibrobacteraceae bacterium]|nr:carboxypeptidase-like regulatory domain-containing protein [Fibrobacteraceae bacterium]